MLLERHFSILSQVGGKKKHPTFLYLVQGKYIIFKSGEKSHWNKISFNGVVEIAAQG